MPLIKTASALTLKKVNQKNRLGFYYYIKQTQNISEIQGVTDANRSSAVLLHYGKNFFLISTLVLKLSVFSVIFQDL